MMKMISSKQNGQAKSDADEGDTETTQTRTKDMCHGRVILRPSSLSFIPLATLKIISTPNIDCSEHCLSHCSKLHTL